MTTARSGGQRVAASNGQNTHDVMLEMVLTYWHDSKAGPDERGSWCVASQQTERVTKTDLDHIIFNVVMNKVRRPPMIRPMHDIHAGGKERQYRLQLPIHHIRCPRTSTENYRLRGCENEQSSVDFCDHEKLTLLNSWSLIWCKCGSNALRCLHNHLQFP